MRCFLQLTASGLSVACAAPGEELSWEERHWYQEPERASGVEDLALGDLRSSAPSAAPAGYGSGGTSGRSPYSPPGV